MTLDEFISELQHRNSAVEQMITNARHVRPDWEASYSQEIYELIDLFQDHTRANDYVVHLKVQFSPALPPDIDKLNRLSALIKSAVTRLKRKPELFVAAADRHSADRFYPATVEVKPAPARTQRTDPEDTHRDLMRRLSILEAVLAERPKRPPGLGHNNPPEGVPTSDEDVAEIERFIDLLKQQPAKSSALPPEIAAQTDKVDKLSKRFFDKCAESAGSELGKKIVNLPFWCGLYSAVRDVVHLVGGWLATP
jgi:hypothetical protein